MRVLRTQVGVFAVAALLALAGRAVGDSSSIAGAGQGGWTTPPAGSLQDAPVPVGGAPSSLAAPPMPPASRVVDQGPYTAPTPYGQPYQPAVAPERSWSGCGLPCASGVSMWYLTGVFGRAFYEGDDPADDCGYWGFDVGRTFCACWGLDLFYRYHSGQFERSNPPQPATDGGGWHHIGAKFTYDFPIAGQFYGWAGVGPEYWWTEGYLDEDDGFGVFGELGVGYVFNRNLRLRAGVNVHWLDTDVTRNLPANDGQSRTLWIIAPVIELEYAF